MCLTKIDHSLFVFHIITICKHAEIPSLRACTKIQNFHLQCGTSAQEFTVGVHLFIYLSYYQKKMKVEKNVRI